jgi:hypothetical protein
MFYADDVNIMDENVYILEKKPEALVVASKETVLKVNADKSKYMFMPLDQNVRLIHNMEKFSNIWDQS